MTLKILAGLILLIAAGAALTLWKAARHERLAEAHWPPEGDFVTIDGHRVHYVMRGEGPDLVLIHGSSGNARDYTMDMMGRLTDRYRVTAFDRPGLGYTDRINTTGATIRQQADLLARAAAEIGITRPVVFGHSYGGAVALAWAVDHPDSLAALALSAPAANPWRTGLGTYYTVLSHPVGQRVVIPFLTAWVPDRVVDDTVTRVFLPQTPPPGYRDHFGPGLTLRRVSMRANAMQRANLLDEIEALAPRYREIDVPVEITHGDADTTVGLRIHSLPLSEQIEGSALTVLPGIGHMPHHAAPVETDASIDRAAARAGLR